MWKCVCDETETCIWWREYTYLIMWKCVCDDVNVHIWWREYTYLIMLGYGHDESVPYTWRNVRTPFRGWALVFHGMFVGILRSVLCVFRWCSPRYRNPSAAFSQTVRSRRGPIYRARISVFTHKKGGGNVRAVVWKCVFNNVKTRIR